MRRQPQHPIDPRVHRQIGGRLVQHVRRGDRDRQVGGQQLDGVDRRRVDQHLIVLGEDLAARRGDRNPAQIVDLGRLRVLVAGEDLQEPEAEEDDREHRQREGADERHAHRELRRHRAEPVVGRPGHRAGLIERSEGRCKGLSAPVV
jgi:hypothetical protein